MDVCMFVCFACNLRVCVSINLSVCVCVCVCVCVPRASARAYMYVRQWIKKDYQFACVGSAVDALRNLAIFLITAY